MMFRKSKGTKRVRVLVGDHELLVGAVVDLPFELAESYAHLGRVEIVAEDEPLVTPPPKLRCSFCEQPAAPHHPSLCWAHWSIASQLAASRGGRR